MRSYHSFNSCQSLEKSLLVNWWVDEWMNQVRKCPLLGYAYYYLQAVLKEKKILLISIDMDIFYYFLLRVDQFRYDKGIKVPFSPSIQPVCWVSIMSPVQRTGLENPTGTPLAKRIKGKTALTILIKLKQQILLILCPLKTTCWTYSLIWYPTQDLPILKCLQRSWNGKSITKEN